MNQGLFHQRRRRLRDFPQPQVQGGGLQTKAILQRIFWVLIVAVPILTWVLK